MVSRTTKEQWFDAGVDALAHSIRVFDDDGDPIEGRYACPMCFAFLTRAALDVDTEEGLTGEHVPPKSSGGRELVLTCKPCNNVAGSAVDRELANHLRREAGLQGKRPLDVVVGPDSLNAQMTILPNGFELRVSREHNHPDRVTEWVDRMTNGTAGTIEVSTHLNDCVDERRVKLSILRAGFLAAFAMNGYRQILGSGYRPFRQQLTAFDEEIVPVLPVLSKPDWPDGIRHARHSTLGASLMFGFKRWRVLLPAHPDDTDWLTRFEAEYVKPTEKLQATKKARAPLTGPEHRLDLAVTLDGDLERAETFRLSPPKKKPRKRR